MTASLNLTWMHKVGTVPEMVKTNLPQLTAAARAVMSEVAAWQSRPLEQVYPVVFFDALCVKIREDAVVRSKAVYLALGSCHLLLQRGHCEAVAGIGWLVADSRSTHQPLA